jgi:hypothetical protein
MSVRSKAVCKLATAGADTRLFVAGSSVVLALAALIAYGLSL